MQINLSMENCWGIVRALVDVVAAMDDGKYLLVKCAAPGHISSRELLVSYDMLGSVNVRCVIWHVTPDTKPVMHALGSRNMALVR